MKKPLIFLLFLLFSFNLKASEWVLSVSGYFENKEMILADNSSLLHYTSKATWNNSLGNYGKSYCFGTILKDKDKKRKQDLVICEYEDTDGESFWMKPKRSGSEWEAGVGLSIIISATKRYEKLIGAKCVYAISYYENSFHGKQKCKI